MPRRNRNAPRNSRRKSALSRAEEKANVKKTKNSKKGKASTKKKDPQSKYPTKNPSRNSNRRRGRSQKSDSSLVGKIYQGRIQMHHDGFGFFIASDPDIPNMYLAPEELKSTLDGDILEVKVSAQYDRGEKLRAQLLKTVERRQSEIIVKLRKYRDKLIAIPTNPKNLHLKLECEQVDLFLYEKKPYAVAKIIEYPDLRPGKIEIVKFIEDQF